MSLGNAAENSVLLLLLNNTAFAGVGDAGGLLASAVAGSLYVSLHTADPGETGSQTTSEANYTSYARVAVARSAAGWTVSGTAPTQGTNAGIVTFPTCTGGSSTCTYFGIGTAASGTGVLLTSGALVAPSSIAVTVGRAPTCPIGSIIWSVD